MHRDGVGMSLQGDAMRRTAVLTTLLYAVLAVPVISADSMDAVVLTEMAVLGLTLATLSAIDAATFRLPDRLTLPLIAAGLAIAGMTGSEQLLRCGAGAVLGYGVLWLVAWAYRRSRGRDGLGLGDAKLLAAAGAWVGVDSLPAVLLMASGLGLVAAFITWLRGVGLSVESRLAFGPFLAVGTWIIWLYEPVF